MVSVGSVIAGAFRLFREQWAAILVWMLCYVVFTVGIGVLFTAQFMREMEGFRTGAISGFGLLPFLLIFYGVTILVSLVLTAAVFRAVMRPEDRAVAFLRLGLDELRLFGLAIVWFVMMFAIYLVGAILAGIVVGILSAASGGGAPGVAMLFALIVLLPVFGVMIFLHIRLSPAIPLTILRRQIALGEAWRLTEGNFWTLFLGYFVVMLIVIVGYVAVFSLNMAPFWSAMSQSGGAGSVRAMEDYRLAQMTAISPLTIISWLANAMLGVAVYVLWAGSVGTATRELLGTEDQDYATTFE